MPDLEHLERCCQLHEHIEIVYVVDGYCVELYTENFPDKVVISARGDSIPEALGNLNTVLSKSNQYDVRKGLIKA